MSKDAPRSGRASTAVLVILLFTAALVTAGLVYLVMTTVDTNIDLHLDAQRTSSQADRAIPVETAEPAPQPETFVISMVGDCTLASSQRDARFDAVVEENGYEWPFSGTVDILGSDDFTLANLECSFTEAKNLAGATFAFRGKAEYAQILSLGSVEAVTNGNNHTPDFGEQGIADTKAALEAVNVLCVGANESQIYETASGLKIGIYNPGWRNATLAGVEEAIPALREAGAEIVIYAPHWGVEGKYHTIAEQDLVAHAAIDAGADIVCGTHPHVMQRMEQYNNGIIFYSLGNYSFGGNSAPRDRDTVIAQVIITRTPDGACSVSGFNLIPCCLSSTEGVNDFRPVPYSEEDEGYARAISKLDDTFTGPDLSVDYSFLNG